MQNWCILSFHYKPQRDRERVLIILKCSRKIFTHYGYVTLRMSDVASESGENTDGESDDSDEDK